MEPLTSDAFERLVNEQYDHLPSTMLEHIENVVIVIEEEPHDGDPDLLGLYEGFALTERADYGFGELPDTITLYQRNLERVCTTVDELQHEIRVTLVHEIAHYFGIDDERLHELGWA